MHEAIKEAVGIKSANCMTCKWFGQIPGSYEDGEPDEEFCEKDDPRMYLTSFPFKKEQACWEPSFFHSKFFDPEYVDPENHDDYMKAGAAFDSAMLAVKEE